MLLVDSLIVMGLATVNLGTIYEADGVQEHVFHVCNNGAEPVTLVQGYTSCGCTTIHFEQGRTLAPSDTTAVTLRFNPRGKGGEFEETGIVRAAYKRASQADSTPTLSAASGEVLRLTLVCTCITSEETLLRQFPVRINQWLRLSADRFDLGRMAVGETKERHLTILHRDEEDRQEPVTVTFTVDKTTPKGLQHIPVTIETNTQHPTPNTQLTITLDVFVL